MDHIQICSDPINYAVVGEAIDFAVPNAYIPGLKEFIASCRPSSRPGNTGLVELWESVFNCILNPNTCNSCKICNGEESLANTNTCFTDVSDASLLNNVYKAVHAVAHAIEGLLTCDKGKGVILQQDMCRERGNTALAGVFF